MLVHPNFDPNLFTFGPLAVRWYGLMYIVGFAAFILLARYRIRRQPEVGLTPAQSDDLAYYGIFGVVLGGRLGYVLFYKAAYYLERPLEIFYVWQGGMSFHGGFLGVLVGFWLWCRTNQRDWLSITDFAAPFVPIGLGAGRLGNFINGELYGRVTDVAWGMVFRGAGAAPRHPSQLYQFALEGVVLFALLWWYSSKRRPRGSVSAMFLLGYGVFRFAVEFFREPDDFLGLPALGLSMGQWLSLPMLIAGIWLLRRARRLGPAG
jgi:phosphatidylglycerol:prolipoprotein diacylglycerol transferase